MKRLLRNRTLIGLMCITLSLVICFGLTPLYNNAMTAQVEITRVKTNIKKGEFITPDKLESIKVGAYNLPANILADRDQIAGQYAVAELQKGDYILSTKLSAAPLAEFEYLATLDGSKQAMSVTIKSFAAGLSGKLEAGDIVTLIAADYGDRRETSMPPELQYMYVLAVTAGSGNDKEFAAGHDNEDERELPSTITVLVCPSQAVLLADLEAKGKLHAALVYRGDKAEAKKFLDAQELFIKAVSESRNDEKPTDFNPHDILGEALSLDMTVPFAADLPDEKQRGNE